MAAHPDLVRTTRPSDVEALRVVGAAKRYGDVQALVDASLDVRSGELVGLLGPNGAGKTTLIKAIAGRTILDRGTIALFGRPIAPRDARIGVGVVPQELAVYPRLTARENLEVFGALNGVTGRALTDRVAWALDWSGLADRAGEPVERFSGGMKRRLNIACSLLHGPSLVLLDEPTVGVDPQSRERIYDMLQTLRQEGLALVLTTHHLEEAEERCQRIVIIDHGRIVASGTVGELQRQAQAGLRTLTVSLREPVPAGRLPAGAAVDRTGRRVRLSVGRLAQDVPDALAAVTAAGGEVVDLDLSGASLHDLFLGLTGKALRE
jgi:ABC-2 type transport system ATP-binding protein